MEISTQSEVQLKAQLDNKDLNPTKIINPNDSSSSDDESGIHYTRSENQLAGEDSDELDDGAVVMSR